ncbi:MAG: hypothetical protein EBE86_013440 [Hormoscilla sp. GUM202]|nr:hypothetical protein [Hormoscilla sp. GUM202]
MQELNRTLGIWQTVETAIDTAAQPLRDLEVVLSHRQLGEKPCGNISKTARAPLAL